MRFLLAAFFLSFCGLQAAAPATSRPATADELALLNQAVRASVQDMRNWAYTETSITRDAKGKVKRHIIVRHDPSKRYEDQWEPLPVNGQPPSQKIVERYRKRGENARKAANNPAPAKPRKSLGEVMDLPRSVIAAEDAERITFEVPLLKQDNARFPPEKFQVFVRVHKQRRALENVAAKLRGSFRVKMIAKIKAGEASMDFAVVDPAHPPVLVSTEGDATVSVMFIEMGGEFDLKRTDHRRVKPYAEKPDVQIGTLKALDF